MVDSTDRRMTEVFQDPMVGTFLLQLHFLCGELEGFNIIGKVLPYFQPTLESARKATISKVKAVMEAFRFKARQNLGKDPEEVPAWQLSLEMLKNLQLQEDIDQIEADRDVLMLLLDGDLIPGPGNLH